MSSKGPRNAMIRQDMLQKAAVLFSERGYASTSLQDIAEAVGLSRPALYYYFKNKEEVLAGLIEEATTYPVQILEKHRKDTAVTPAERLQRAMKELITWIIRSPVIIKLLESNEARLPADIGEEHFKARRRVLKAFVDMINDGIETGDFRPVDPRLAAFALIGMGNWTAWWYSAGRERPAEEVAEQFAQMGVQSLRWEVRTVAKGGSIDEALSLLKTDLAQLEQAIEGERSKGRRAGSAAASADS